MSSDASEPAGFEPRAHDLARSVAEELGPIFAATAQDAAGGRRSRVHALGPKAPRRGLPIATLGAVFAAGVVGLSLGGVVAHRGGPSEAPVASRPSGPPIRVAEAAPLPSPLPLLAPVPAAPPQVARTEQPRVHDHVQLRQAHATRRHAVHKPRLYTAHVRTCAGADRDERAWCSHRAVMAADDRLRRAYHTAERAGVSRPVLASYRDRWADLRHRAVSDPDEVVSGYSEMASDLSRMAGSHRRSGARHGWWFWG